MELRFEKVNKTNWETCAYLRITQEQDEKDFCAPNWYSIIEASYNNRLYPYCIYDGDTMIGFFMYGFDEDINHWALIRYMFDHKYQNQGYGRVALNNILELVKKEIPLKEFYTCVEPENIVATRLYEGVGFQKTGEVSYGEDVMVLSF